MAKHFHLKLEFPSQGDRLALHRFFVENPFLNILSEFFAGRLTAEECHEKITALQPGEGDQGEEG